MTRFCLFYNSKMFPSLQILKPVGWISSVTVRKAPGSIPGRAKDGTVKVTAVKNAWDINSTPPAFPNGTMFEHAPNLTLTFQVQGINLLPGTLIRYSLFWVICIRASLLRTPFEDERRWSFLDVSSAFFFFVIIFRVVFPLSLSDHNFVCIPHLSHACYMSRRHDIPLGSKYSSQHPVLKLSIGISLFCDLNEIITQGFRCHNSFRTRIVSK
jgi:hypothetical protein